MQVIIRDKTNRNFLSDSLKINFTSYRPILTWSHFVKSSFSGIQWNFEIGFRCLVLLEKVSFVKIFEEVTQKIATTCK